MRQLILFLFVFIAHLSHGQYKIFGKTYDANGKILPNAEVVLKIGKQNDVSKSSNGGAYSFEGLKPQSYQVILKKGMQEESFSVTVQNENIELDLFLFDEDASNSTLNDLVINVESVKSKLEKEGFAVNVIETKEAAIRNIQTNELLDRSVGVRVRQNGGLGASVDYNLNGMSGNSVKIFIDGIPLATYGASFNLNSIPPALIERIEVYKGVVPIHLSDDALGGAINVVLKRGVSNSLNASLSYGSFNTWQGNFSGVARNDKSGFTIKASSFYNFSDNDYEVWGKFVKNVQPNGRVERVRAKRFNDAYKSLGGQVEAGFTNVSWADQFFIGFNGSDSYREIQHGTYMTKPYMGRFEESDSQQVSLNYKKNNFIVKGLNFNVTGMYSKRHQVVNDTVKWNYNWFGEHVLDLDGNPILSNTGAQQGAATINHSRRKVYTLRGNLSYDIHDNHRIVFNHLYYSFDRNDNDDMKSILERSFVEDRSLTKNISGLAYEMKAFQNKLKTNLFSKYYQQELEKIKPTIKNINGVNTKDFETFNNKYDYLGYGLATSYLMKSSITLLGSYEKAIRLPVENEIFGDVGENIVENNSLQAEVSDNFNVGFKVGPYQINKHKVSLGANGFLRDTKDRIVRKSNTRINDAEQTAPFENLSSTQSKGFDVEFMYEYNKRLMVFANASRFNTVYSKKYDSSGNLFGYYNQQLPNEPFFTASGSVQYMIPNLIMKESVLNLHYAFNMIEPFYTNWLETDDFRTPKQFIQDLGLSYVFPNKQFIVSFDVKNIFNKEAYDNFAVQKPGRAFYVKLNYSFNKF